MEPLSPIFIASWADDVDDYEANGCLTFEEAMCQPDVSAAQVAQLKAAAAALCLRHPSQTAKQQEGCASRFLLTLTSLAILHSEIALDGAVHDRNVDNRTHKLHLSPVVGIFLVPRSYSSVCMIRTSSRIASNFTERFPEKSRGTIVCPTSC